MEKLFELIIDEEDESGVSMIALVEEAQADTVAKLGPRNPYFIDTCPAVISAIILGMKNGLNLGVPSPSKKFINSF